MIETAIGIEFGSTRIKAVAADGAGKVLSKGSHEWENRLTDGEWTYSEEDIISGLRAAFGALKADHYAKTGEKLRSASALGISGMMHGYLPVDAGGKMLSRFLTWRNTSAHEEAEELSALFGFNIPARWSIAHLYRQIKTGAAHLGEIYKLTTLSGYVHYLLSGSHAVGADEASGIFPLSGTEYDRDMAEKFNKTAEKYGFFQKIPDIFPAIVPPGNRAGFLTEAGALLLDPTGEFGAGVPMCAPEGDAATGMVATNSVSPGTANVSAGTSVFSMTVLKKPLSSAHTEIDIVATPEGAPVAMIHCNNGTGDMDDWTAVFGEALQLFGLKPTKEELYSTLYGIAEKGSADAGGITDAGFLSGESILDLNSAVPVFVRPPDRGLRLADIMKAKFYAVFAALRYGTDILEKEGVKADIMCCHGGYFKSRAGLETAANALKTAVRIYPEAGEGGAWGMALLALYMIKGGDKTLGGYLAEDIFAGISSQTLAPTSDGMAGFDKYFFNFLKTLPGIRLISDRRTEI